VKPLKVVVTDYIEDNLDWEAEELAKASLHFEAFQLKFKPEAEVIEHIADADIIGVGRIGSRVYRKLKSSGLKFLANDPYLSEKRRTALNLDFVEQETRFHPYGRPWKSYWPCTSRRRQEPG